VSRRRIFSIFFVLLVLVSCTHTSSHSAQWARERWRSKKNPGERKNEEKKKVKKSETFLILFFFVVVVVVLLGGGCPTSQ